LLDQKHSHGVLKSNNLMIFSFILDGQEAHEEMFSYSCIWDFFFEILGQKLTNIMQKVQIYSKLNPKKIKFFFNLKRCQKFPKKKNPSHVLFQFFYWNIIMTLIGNTYIVKIVETIEK